MNKINRSLCLRTTPLTIAAVMGCIGTKLAANLFKTSSQAFQACLDYVSVYVCRRHHPFPKLMVDLTESMSGTNPEAVPGSRPVAIKPSSIIINARHRLRMPGRGNDYYSTGHWHVTCAFKRTAPQCVSRQLLLSLTNATPPKNTSSSSHLLRPGLYTWTPSNTFN
jgi:hypothetical protein